ncbi:hypothetical protein HYH02_011962 [Chlamydomonas schloesseri]|uniref:Uncharacterized protein n=1 Tax=Chlamydomonas schloesseri TaxID=2026947 RepID=A0A835VZX1_9CHLO|nr:hypothetical protein HYH02_011962 [Chlamydomonas schloesseri]|eukprot:KAG2435462.1 hypothetical protein HYH02_011962 [Chlamydomonas schloesseri]
MTLNVDTKANGESPSNWSRLTPDLIRKVARGLHPNEVAGSLVLLNRETAGILREEYSIFYICRKVLAAWRSMTSCGYGKVRVIGLAEQPWPGAAFVAYWGRPEPWRALSLPQRRRLLALAASSGHAASLDAALAHAGCSRDEEVPEAAAAAGDTSALARLLLREGCDWTPQVTRAAAHCGALGVLRWLRRAAAAGVVPVCDVSFEVIAQAALGGCGGGLYGARLCHRCNASSTDNSAAGCDAEGSRRGDGGGSSSSADELRAAGGLATAAEVLVWLEREQGYQLPAAGSLEGAHLAMAATRGGHVALFEERLASLLVPHDPGTPERISNGRLMALDGMMYGCPCDMLMRYYSTWADSRGELRGTAGVSDGVGWLREAVASPTPDWRRKVDWALERWAAIGLADEHAEGRGGGGGPGGGDGGGGGGSGRGRGVVSGGRGGARGRGDGASGLAAPADDQPEPAAQERQQGQGAARQQQRRRRSWTVTQLQMVAPWQDAAARCPDFLDRIRHLAAHPDLARPDLLQTMLLPNAAVAAARRGRVEALDWLLRQIKAAAGKAGKRAGAGGGGGGGDDAGEGPGEGGDGHDQGDEDRPFYWLTARVAPCGHVGVLRLMAEVHGLRFDCEQLQHAAWKAWKAGRVAGVGYLVMGRQPDGSLGALLEDDWEGLESMSGDSDRVEGDDEDEEDEAAPAGGGAGGSGGGGGGGGGSRGNGGGGGWRSRYWSGILQKVGEAGGDLALLQHLHAARRAKVDLGAVAAGGGVAAVEWAAAVSGCDQPLDMRGAYNIALEGNWAVLAWLRRHGRLRRRRTHSCGSAAVSGTTCSASGNSSDGEGARIRLPATSEALPGAQLAGLADAAIKTQPGSTEVAAAVIGPVSDPAASLAPQLAPLDVIEHYTRACGRGGGGGHMGGLQAWLEEAVGLGAGAEAAEAGGCGGGVEEEAVGEGLLAGGETDEGRMGQRGREEAEADYWYAELETAAAVLAELRVGGEGSRHQRQDDGGPGAGTGPGSVAGAGHAVGAGEGQPPHEAAVEAEVPAVTAAEGAEVWRRLVAAARTGWLAGRVAPHQVYWLQMQRLAADAAAAAVKEAGAGARTGTGGRTLG